MFFAKCFPSRLRARCVKTTCLFFAKKKMLTNERGMKAKDRPRAVAHLSSMHVHTAHRGLVTNCKRPIKRKRYQRWGGSSTGSILRLACGVGIR